MLKKDGDQNTSSPRIVWSGLPGAFPGPSWSMGPSGAVTDTHTHEITQNSGALPALQRETLQYKKVKGRRWQSFFSTWTHSHPCNYVFVFELFYFFLATGPAPPGDVISPLPPPSPPSAKPKGCRSRTCNLGLCEDICSPQQIPPCCSFRLWVGKKHSLEAQSVGATPPLPMAQLLKSICF